MKNQLLKELSIKNDLNPENCTTLGYEWIKDIIYDREAPIEAMQDIIDLVEKEGYLLGESAAINGKMNNIYGLYKKI